MSTVFQALLTFIYHIQGQSQETYQTNIIWTTSQETYTRPGWAGDVTITYTEASGSPGQIWKVYGIVVPISTSGRPSAPDPWNGYPTGTAYGLDKGHVLALSNGGPDISRNIVPQSAQWQRTGGWRQVEIAVYDFAMNRYGWNSVVHASEAFSIPKPNSLCDVVFSVDILVYDYDTGEPQTYDGYTNCGAELYSFTISPTDDAVWFPSPPSLSYNGTVIQSTVSGNDNGGSVNFQIVMIICVISVLYIGS